jgi:DNA-binding NarL/FixJ family response regulator
MRILVVDDQPIVCDALARYLEHVGAQDASTPMNVVCVYTLADAISAIRADDGRPDLVFLDLNLDRNAPSTATLERFQEQNRYRIPVVVFTGLFLNDPGTIEILRRCLHELGAQTVLLKGTDLATMFIGLPRILAFETWLSKDLINALLAAPAASPNASFGLSPRQWDVATLLTRGLTNKQIARQLGISDKNVQQITGAVYKRLGVHSRGEAAYLLRDHVQGSDRSPRT